VKTEKRKALEHALRILRIEYPDAHPYTLALKVQLQTGHQISGQLVRHFLLTGTLEMPSHPDDL
jgi:hypothetical protein